MTNHIANKPKVYDETEKEFFQSVAVHENNTAIYNMIKDHIDGHITERLVLLCKSLEESGYIKKASQLYTIEK